MNKFIPLLIIALFISCSCRNSANRIANKHLSKIETQIKADSTKGEDFLSFFDQFKKDTLFQQERVYLPFYRCISGDDGTGVIHDTVSYGNDKKDWYFCSFLINDSIKYFHQDIVVKHDTVEVRLSQNPASYDSKKIDAGFVRKNGKWFNYSIWITR